MRHPLLPVFDPLSRDSMSRLVVRPSASADRVPQRAGLVRFRLFGAHGHGAPPCQDAAGRAGLGWLVAGPGSDLSEEPAPDPRRPNESHTTAWAADVRATGRAPRTEPRQAGPTRNETSSR